MIYAQGMAPSNMVIGPPGPPGPCTVSFDYAATGSLWTIDGSNIYIYVTASGHGTATESWDFTLHQWQMTNYSGSCSWTGTAHKLKTAPQINNVTPGSGTVTLAGSEGTIAQLDYTTSGTGTMVLGACPSSSRLGRQ